MRPIPNVGKFGKTFGLWGRGLVQLNNWMTVCPYEQLQEIKVEERFVAITINGIPMKEYKIWYADVKNYSG